VDAERIVRGDNMSKKTTTTEPTGAENQTGAVDTGSPEEVAWNSLTGGSQDRFKQMARDVNRLRAEKERLEQYASTLSIQNAYQPTAQGPIDPANPQVRDAVSQLSKVGIATKDEVSQQINQSIGNFIYNFELDKLGQQFDGSNGLPKFDRDEYTDYITRNPKYQGYDPVDVYNKMYSEEIMDAKIKGIGGQTQPTSSLRPNSTTVREEQWTPEAIEQRLQQPDRKEWYSKNIDLVNKVMSSQKSQ